MPLDQNRGEEARAWGVRGAGAGTKHNKFTHVDDFQVTLGRDNGLQGCQVAFAHTPSAYGEVDGRIPLLVA
jgi:hypothetical protein